MDDIDEFGDIDTAMRAQFDQLKNQINELKPSKEKKSESLKWDFHEEDLFVDMPS